MLAKYDIPSDCVIYSQCYMLYSENDKTEQELGTVEEEKTHSRNTSRTFYTQT